jgi:Leucine-rich repeat (LRR) protein
VAPAKPSVESVTPEGGQPMKKRLLIALIPLTILMLISSGAVYAADKTTEIKFADPNVESAVREVLGKPGGTIHEDDVKVITWLIIHANPLPWEKNSIDLSGLEYLSRLNQLEIINASVNDFSPLSGLADCESVQFNSCEITDLASLSTLPNLKSLSFRDCQMNGPSSMKLSNLTGLRQLSITDTDISDISQLSFPAGLWSLHLQNNRISDIPQLSNLTNLVSLSIADNQISDITPLSELSRLYSLTLYGNQISDISPLAELSKLCSLTLAENQIRDITPLAALNTLGYLNLSGNHISNIDSLSSLSNLNRLDLQDNDIADLAPLLKNDIQRPLVQSRNYLSDGETRIESYTLELRVKGNPLSDASIEDYIPQLNEMGVVVDY